MRNGNDKWFDNEGKRFRKEINILSVAQRH